MKKIRINATNSLLLEALVRTLRGDQNFWRLKHCEFWHNCSGKIPAVTSENGLDEEFADYSCGAVAIMHDKSEARVRAKLTLTSNEDGLDVKTILWIQLPDGRLDRCGSTFDPGDDVNWMNVEWLDNKLVPESPPPHLTFSKSA